MPEFFNDLLSPRARRRSAKPPTVGLDSAAGGLYVPEMATSLPSGIGRRAAAYGFLAGGLLLAGLTACQTTPRLKGRNTEVVSRGGLAELNPVDVAVAPVRLANAEVTAPTESIRRAAQIGLARNRYTPLSIELVDRKIAAAPGSPVGTQDAATLPASYMPGDVGEDAVFEVTVYRWDDRNWEIRRSVDVALEARMIDPRDPLGPPLWAGRIDHVFDVSGDISTAVKGRRAVQAVCDKIFLELLAPMPPRSVNPHVEPIFDDEGFDEGGFDEGGFDDEGLPAPTEGTPADPQGPPPAPGTFSPGDGTAMEQAPSDEAR